MKWHKALSAWLGLQSSFCLASGAPPDATVPSVRASSAGSEDVDRKSAARPRPIATNLPPGAKALTTQSSVGQLVLYSIKINQQNFKPTALLRLADGSLLARRADMKSWRLKFAVDSSVTYEEEQYFPLSSLDGYRVQVDNERQALDLEFSAQAFEPTFISFGSFNHAVPEPAGWGAFFNYDFFGTVTQTRSRTKSYVDGAFELGTYTPGGVLVATALAQNLAGNAAAIEGREARLRLLRLETTWTHDVPSEAKSLQLGDTISTGSIWGRPVRYGGLRWGTNFATQPGFVTLPLPAAGGEAVLPSTVELYIDGVLRQRAALPPGPFQTSDLPTVTGMGEARLVVRDILGREQVITQPYYASSTLLKKGLSDNSFEVGFLRENFGLRGNDYGPAMGSVTLRAGVTDHLTTELRGEVSRGQRTAGIGVSAIAAVPVVLSAAVGMSRGQTGAGKLGFLAAEHQSKRISFGVRSQWTNASFVQLGRMPGQRELRQQTSARVGFPVGEGSSFGLAYLRLLSHRRSTDEVFAASYSMRAGRSAWLNFSANMVQGRQRYRTFSVTLVLPFDEGNTLVASVSGQPGTSQAHVQFQRSVPAGNGYGYRLLAGTGTSGDRKEAGISMHTDTGTYTLDAGEAQGTSIVRASGGGGLVLIGGRAMLSRRIGDAFAVAEVPGHSDVGLYVNNQIVARTDRQGFAVIPRLLPYQKNAVRVDPAELSLDAAIDSTQVHAVPHFRRGLALKFPVRRSAGALIQLLLDDGGPMPQGAIVMIEGGKESFPVAQRGEVYVTGLAAVNRLFGSWGSQSCTVTVKLAADAGPIPTIGPLKCSGLTR